MYWLTSAALPVRFSSLRSALSLRKAYIPEACLYSAAFTLDSGLICTFVYISPWRTRFNILLAPDDV